MGWKAEPLPLPRCLYRAKYLKAEVVSQKQTVVAREITVLLLWRRLGISILAVGLICIDHDFGTGGVGNSLPLHLSYLRL